MGICAVKPKVAREREARSGKNIGSIIVECVCAKLLDSSIPKDNERNLEVGDGASKIAPGVIPASNTVTSRRRISRALEEANVRALIGFWFAQPFSTFFYVNRTHIWII